MNETLDAPMKSDCETNLQTDFRANFDTDLEANFNAAMNMCAQTHHYDELISLLNSEKIAEKQIAALELNEIKSKKDALILTSNLVGQDGKIREAVAFKINELAQNPAYFDFFIDDKLFGLFLQGIMDINGNVCRQIVGGKWFENIEFQTYLCNKLPERIREILKHIEKLGENEKQYKISKRNFQLYWCLESLHNIIDVINIDEIKHILNQTAEFEDYTIREKTAKILAKLNNQELNKLKEKLKGDENYYVRRYLK